MTPSALSVRPVGCPGRRAVLASALLGLGGLLSGCAGLRTGPEAPAFLLRLPPASLGRELMLTQHMEIRTAMGARAFDVALEVDAEAVRLAVMQWGQVMARMSWDGHELTQSTVPGWPRQVSAEGVLSDLQLVWWPAEAVRAALPPGWMLQDNAQGRVLLDAGQPVTTVRRLDPERIELTQHRQGYTVLVSSQDAAQADTSSDQQPGQTR